jgi:hypothetical protein
MKKIFIFRQWASSPEKTGGTRHYILSSALIKNDYDVTIFTSNFNHHKKIENYDFKESYHSNYFNGVRFIWIKSFPYFKNNWRRFVNIIDFSVKSFKISLDLLKYEKVPDVVIGSIAHIFTVFIAYLLKIKTGSKFFLDIGELWPQVFVATGKMGKYNPICVLLNKIMFFLYNKSDYIICSARDSESYLKKIGYGRKLLYIPPGIEIDANYSNTITKKKNSVTYLYYAGSFQPIYPIKSIIDAAKILQDEDKLNIRYVLIGDGSEKNKLIEYANGLKLKNIEFKESMPKKELISNLRNADGFLLVEKYKSFGFSNKLIDYLFIGRPLIYAAPTTNPDLENAQFCYYHNKAVPNVISDDSHSIANLSEKKWIEMCCSAKKYLAENHDINMIAKRLIAFL